MADKKKFNTTLRISEENNNIFYESSHPRVLYIHLVRSIYSLLLDVKVITSDIRYQTSNIGHEYK